MSKVASEIEGEYQFPGDESRWSEDEKSELFKMIEYGRKTGQPIVIFPDGLTCCYTVDCDCAVCKEVDRRLGY